MRFLKLHTFSIIALLSLSSIAHSRCFTYVFLGAADKGRHFHRGEWVEKKAKAMGCLVLKTFNVRLEESNKQIATFLRTNSFDPKEDKLHISFVDHGSRRSLPYDKLKREKYEDVLRSLDETLPKGSHVTFSSQICWPRFSETIIQSKFSNIASICGASSVSRERMSNAISDDTDKARMKEYLPVGWDLWNKNYEENRKGIMLAGVLGTNKGDSQDRNNLFNFHYSALSRDPRNLQRGANLTSLVFLKDKLTELGENAYEVPLEEFFEYGDSARMPFPQWSKSMLLTSPPDKSCITKPVPQEFSSIFDLYSIVQKIMNQESQNKITKLAKQWPLLKPYEEMFNESYKRLSDSWAEVNKLSKSYQIQRKDIDKRLSKAYSEDKTDLAAKINNEWDELERQMYSKLRGTLVDLRKLNDIYMITRLAEKSPKDMEQFNLYLACERQKSLDF